MRAAFFERTGGPEVVTVGERPTPEPGPGEVRVRVETASLNPIDTYFRSGAAVNTAGWPVITGRDFAGVVDAVGPTVTAFRPGDRVWGANQGAGGRPGSFAEYTVAGEEWLYPRPANISAADAAALALVGVTAHIGLFQKARLQPGEWVFVNGGTGGVGAVVVQMAKAAGAKVIATVGSAEKGELARSLGADVVANYKSDDVAGAVKAATAGRGVDVWYETVPPTDFERTFDLTAPRGRVVVMAGRAAKPAFPNGTFYLKELSLFGFAMFNNTAAELRAAADDMNRWAAAGTLRALIGREFPLEQAAEAHRLQEENTLHKSGTLAGKIVVRVG